MIRTCDLNAAPDLRGVGRLQMVGLGSTEWDSTPVRPDCQTLGALLEQAQETEDRAAAIVAYAIAGLPRSTRTPSPAGKDDLCGGWGMKQDLFADILRKLDRGDGSERDWPNHKGEYLALCPFHADAKVGNFSVSSEGKYHCFACGAEGGALTLAQRFGIEVEHAAPAGPVTLAAYADAKRLDVELLRGHGLRDRKYLNEPAIRIPYMDESGAEVAVRFRIALSGKDKFRWAKGSRLLLYGLWRLAELRAAGYVILVEGESDSHTLWQHGLPALGVPGAATFKKEWTAALAGLPVFVWCEPDAGGVTFAKKIGEALPDCSIMFAPAGRKDISECHLAGDDVPALVADLRAKARPWRELEAELRNERAATARRVAGDLLSQPCILDTFEQECRRLGLVGERRNVRLLYLVFVSRLLDRIVSAVVKGPSSGGKSFTLETVMQFFPISAFYALSSLSDRALAYSQEPLAHRIMVVFEAAGLTSEFGSYLMRSLLSEGRLRYETVERTDDGLKPKLIERAGTHGVDRYDDMGKPASGE